VDLGTLETPLHRTQSDMAHGRPSISIDEERRDTSANNRWASHSPVKTSKQVGSTALHFDNRRLLRQRAESGPPRSPLQWMPLRKPSHSDCWSNHDQATGILGESSAFPGVAPNPAQREHKLPHSACGLLGYFPTPTTTPSKKEEVGASLGSTRTITPGAVIHESGWNEDAR